jgi:hypothetical protein
LVLRSPVGDHGLRTNWGRTKDLGRTKNQALRPKDSSYFLNGSLRLFERALSVFNRLCGGFGFDR